MLVSVEGMSAKGTRKILNVAFKQVQRLPDWPIIKLNHTNLLSEKSEDRNVRKVSYPTPTTEDGTGARALAE